MMAYDSRSTPEPRPLGDETIAALREAVLHLWTRPEVGEDVLHIALAKMVEDSRSRSLRAEEVIVGFKELLASLHALNNGERRLESVRFRERLITLCIKAYYSN
jgi:hypothetical protein